MSMALVAFGLAAVAPRGTAEFAELFQAPPGLALAALVLMAIGHSVEERGTIRRIRLGVGLRLVAVAVLGVAVIWAMMLGAPMPSLVTVGLIMGVPGFVGVAIALQHDWGVYGDVRYGQSIRLVELSRSGMVIESKGAQATLAIADILAVRAVQDLEGRAVVFLVKEDVRKRHAVEMFPWVGATPQGDTFVLTEHQLGKDVEEMMTEVLKRAKEAQA